jgi:hypothetical protein
MTALPEAAPAGTPMTEPARSRADASPRVTAAAGGTRFQEPAPIGAAPSQFSRRRPKPDPPIAAEPSVANVDAVEAIVHPIVAEAMSAEAVATYIMELRADLDTVMARLDEMAGPQPAPPGYLALKRAAGVLGVSIETLRRRAAARAIPSVRIGARWFVRCGIEESTPRPDGDTASP